MEGAGDDCILNFDAFVIGLSELKRVRKKVKVEGRRRLKYA